MACYTFILSVENFMHLMRDFLFCELLIIFYLNFISIGKT
uniref:Uncharacterized protein n=1 Tax=Rhizophora mucronata TaxID=61149 RepID=A0A2P2K9N1_RHIMU